MRLFNFYYFVISYVQKINNCIHDFQISWYYFVRKLFNFIRKITCDLVYPLYISCNSSIIWCTVTTLCIVYSDSVFVFHSNFRRSMHFQRRFLTIFKIHGWIIQRKFQFRFLCVLSNADFKITSEDLLPGFLTLAISIFRHV